MAQLIHWAGQIAWGLGAPIEPPPWVVGVTGRMRATDAIAWAGQRPLWRIVGGETFRHWPAHSADLERAAKVTV